MNYFSSQVLFRIEEASALYTARRQAADMAHRAGFCEVATGRVALVVTEAASNILKHGVRGEIMIRVVTHGSEKGIEILALDRGPGMKNLEASMHDGVSTAGSYGVGLGAISRLANDFDIYTAPGKGTAVWMLLWRDQKQTRRFKWEIGCVCLPIPSELECGDTWAAVESAHGLSVMVADGLGHGPEAATASQAAVEVVQQAPDLPPDQAVQKAHLKLHGTRGAAVAVAHLDTMREELQFAGIGNIAACIVQNTEARQMMSHNGIVGSNLRKLQLLTSPWTPDALLIMHSDGLGTRWDLNAYPGLSSAHPALIAGVLYRDFIRGRDDVTVLVIRAASHVRPAAQP